MATTEQEMVVRGGRPEAAAAEERMKPARVLTALAEELDVRVEGSKVDVPPETEEAARAWIDDYRAKLTRQTESYLDRQADYFAELASRQVATIGEPTHVGYVYWDLISISPIQFVALPPYQPSKIIASNELALFQAVLFINPATNIFNPISATTILGGRDFRVRFEQVNLTDVTNGPDFTFIGTFPSPAPALTFFSQFIIAPDPGQNSRLVEQNVTADITDIAQPFAAFATNQFDVDSDPGFLNIPPQPPQFQHDIPLRYLIYSK
jgi:hypothetical protein